MFAYLTKIGAWGYVKLIAYTIVGSGIVYAQHRGWLNSELATTIGGLITVIAGHDQSVANAKQEIKNVSN